MLTSCEVTPRLPGHVGRISERLRGSPAKTQQDHGGRTRGKCRAAGPGAGNPGGCITHAACNRNEPSHRTDGRGRSECSLNPPESKSAGKGGTSLKEQHSLLLRTGGVGGWGGIWKTELSHRRRSLEEAWGKGEAGAAPSQPLIPQ